MTPALDDSQRKLLEGLVGRARRLLEDDLAAQASGRYGIDRDGTIAERSTLQLSLPELAVRDELAGLLKYLASEGETAAGAVERLLREAVFTQLNRLVTIRIWEELGLLPPSLVQGTSSKGFREFLQLVPLLADDATGGYSSYLQLCGDELAGDVHSLFDPRNPLLSLRPSSRALGKLVSEFAEPSHASLWNAPDCLGWVYQFFNTGEERRKMREAGAPRNSRELAVRNQFFTPRYVVDFLVQNTLGRRLLDAEPGSPLLNDLPLVIDPPRSRGLPLDLAEVAVLDPACGSGHFLLAAYDVLERAWLYTGVQPAQAAPQILRSLWGIDIDPRCCQVAEAALILRARRSCRTGELPRPNVICARSLPSGVEMADVLAGLTPSLRQLVSSMGKTLNDAPVLGPLLKVEDRLTFEIRRASFGGTPVSEGSLAEAVPVEDLERLEHQALDALQTVADATTASPAERLLAAEIGDALRFVHALLRKYDAVLTNPPFGDPVPANKPYLKSAYPWIPTKDQNLFAAFVGRGLELCAAGGYVGAITSRSGMFLKTFEKWRHHVMLNHKLVALADLGYGVMEQALVEAAAYVIAAEAAPADHRVRFVRLLKDTQRPQALASAVEAARSGIPDSRLYQVSLRDLAAVPGSPIAYWMSPSIRRLFTDYPPLEGHGAEVRVGLQTGDDFRFVRAFWEVDPARIGRSREETKQGKRWVPFAKGGEYSPYWADIHLVVDWENDGERIRGYSGSRPQNVQFYFRPGVTWPNATQFGFNPRTLPAGVIFSHMGPSAFPRSTVKESALLAFLHNRLLWTVLRMFVAFQHFEVGIIQRMPWPGSALGDGDIDAIARLGTRLALTRAAIDAGDENTRLFVGPDVLLTDGSRIRERSAMAAQARENKIASAIELALAAERIIHKSIALDQDGEDLITQESGPHPSSYPATQLTAEEEVEFARYFRLSIKEIVELGSDIGGSRQTPPLKSYFFDRRLEYLAHLFRRHPQVIAETRHRLGVLPPEEPLASAHNLFSYLVGAAFGRWDVRIGRDPSLEPPLSDPLEAVPLCSPGMLLGDDGLPERSAPEGYPLELSPRRLLVDQPGHKWDIESRIISAAEVLFDDPDPMVADLLRTLGSRSIREHLRRRFFKQHLSRYSKSRRTAPIYWPLYVPSGKWGVWVYAPNLTRETLFAIEAVAAARLDLTGTEIQHLMREKESGGAGRSVREAVAALEAEEALAEELGTFRQQAQHVANLGWEPDLDDGIVLCAAPLSDLFPAWKDAVIERQSLKDGKYPWASVSRWADRL